MKKLIFIPLFFCFMQAVVTQQYEQPSPNSIAFFFEEVKAATARHATIWDRDLYGPFLLIDPQTGSFLPTNQTVLASCSPLGISIPGISPTILIMPTLPAHGFNVMEYALS